MKYITLFLSLLIGLNALGQKDSLTDTVRYSFALKLLGEPEDFPAKKLRYENTPKKVAQVDRQADKVLQQIRGLGYIDTYIASYDTLDGQIEYSYQIGGRYKWKKLDPGNVDEGALGKIDYRDKLYLNQPLAYGEVQRLFEKLIVYYENNGYPFASIRLDSVEIEDGQVSAQLYLEKNRRITIDTIKVKGSTKLSRKYLFNYIGIKQGDPYDEQRVRQIETRVKELPFVSPIQPAQTEFFMDKTSLTLYLNQKKANFFDGIIGFLPDDNTGKLEITGDVKIHLKSAFNRGEEIEMNWRRLQTQTQDLFGRFRYPFLFNSPFGAEASIKIYRRDTTFTTVTTNLGLQYIFRGGDYIEVFWESDQSNLISTYDLDIATQLPDVADVRNNSFGLGAEVTQLNYRLNPRKGFDMKVKAGFGNREIRRNPNVNQALYDSLNLKTNSYKAIGNARFFVPIFTRQTLMFGFKGAVIANEKLFQNEMYRIGGLKTLRGFDEESIFASAYTIFTFEYRFLIEQNSYLQVFYEQAWYENQAASDLITDTPFGFGAGISFQTKAGIFSLSYALGKQFDNPIVFRASKIHFGYVNFF